MSIDLNDVVDAELVPTQDEALASVERATEHVAGFWSELQWQIENKAWQALDYEDFGHLWEERYAGLGVTIGRKERPDLVAAMRSIGQTQQEIADKLGVNHATVSRDLANASSGDLPTTITNSRGQERPMFYDRAPSNVNTETGEIHDEPVKTTGMDGKTYARPEPAEPPKPRRRPIQDAARDAGWDLRKAVERIERLTADDRFSSNKEEVATQMRGHLLDAIDSCQGILDRLPTEKES